MKRSGILFVISAPSGAGKTSLCRRIVDIFPDMRHSVSFTTRPKRDGETDGIDYHFVSQDCFDTMVADGAFAEWARVHGNCYGTALATLQEARDQGRDVLLDIDCQGAAQLKRSCPDGVFIFILPPTFEELERRLRGRNTDTPEVIGRRLANARREMRELVWYDYLVVNDDLSRASEELKGIILAEGCRTGRTRDSVVQQFGIDKQEF
ncbi:MAG: guanylate kinase [Syntrophotalea acetylenica]|jgi:guanylate kinase|uniref:Guanylate kinase n=1 Tax=Syntrophotalea acetylenica TaxID=29542 RepID=A0A1L3GHU1_SYNAC|nr:guanylate kinase [Syntrophotalea acetylenica]APG25514.1 guanylate kinase [Syntrophotalea acetylenica]APG43579.1 guanylate kinase [Syntrophotalea acetylenica]MDD4458143.1 guanylate kinase [Syntrophotalea acetylenica]MDY0262088.1 guanylate kinase [Syntrophotalea acetylenica]